MQTPMVVQPYASIGRRFVALVLDFLILMVPIFVLNHIIPVIGGLLISFFYTPFFESSELRATLGKHLMGVQVTDLGGRRISFQTAVVRYFVSWVSGLLLCLGYVIAFFTQRKQALHDLVAETVVVYGRSERNAMDAWTDQVRSVFRRSVPALSPTAELERLQALREKGALTEEEFQQQKAAILNRR